MEIEREMTSRLDFVPVSCGGIMQYLACTYGMVLGLLVSVTNLMEMLYLTLTDSYHNNANMHPDYKSLFFSFFSQREVNSAQ